MGVCLLSVGKCGRNCIQSLLLNSVMDRLYSEMPSILTTDISKDLRDYIDEVHHTASVAHVACKEEKKKTQEIE